MNAILGLFNLIPVWLWAGALAAAMATNCVSLAQRDSARRDLAGEQVKVANLKTAIAEQKAQASKILADETAKALDAERRARELKDQLEKQDAANAKKIDDLRADLVRQSRAAGGPGLRDPFAPRCPSWGGGGGAQATPAAGAASSPGDDTGAGRQLSVELENFLIGKFTRADEINRAYEACRIQLFNDRKDEP